MRSKRTLLPLDSLRRLRPFSDKGCEVRSSSKSGSVIDRPILINSLYRAGAPYLSHLLIFILFSPR